VKEGLARLVVELSKKTWPQQWPTFLEDLDVLTGYGATQVEVVLLVFRRLAEDLHVHTDTSLTSTRRKEMGGALREHIKAIYHFLMQNLEFPAVASLCGVALSTITVYVEWVGWSDLLSDDCKLLRLLYSFISVEQLKTGACECLLAILSRKGDLKRTMKEREKLLVLLSKDALQVILDASMQAASLGVDEVQYVFLKRVCQVLVELGTSQIARLWDVKFQAPPGFEIYLKVMLEFFKHQSQLLCMTATSLWSVFLAHSYITDNPTFRNILTELFPEACKKLLRVGNPYSSSTDAITEYNRIDFDDPNEYITFYSMFRNRLTIMLTRMCQKAAIPDNTFAQTLALATTLTQQAPTEECTKDSMLYLEWDAFVAVMECWTNVMKADTELRAALSEKATALTHLVLNYDPKDALVLCCVLRCLNSGLMWVLDLDPSKLLQPYLQKVFSCIQCLGELRSKERKVLAAQNIAMQGFVKLCSVFGDLLLPHLVQLFEQYATLTKKELLTYSMKSSFTEGFVILNLLRPDLQQQAVFLRQLMQEANTLLQELQQCGALSSLEGLVQYLGLHTSPSDITFCPEHRAQLCYVAHVISVVLKKSVSSSDGQASAEQHPSYHLTVPLLSQFILPLIGLLHDLWSGKAKHLTSTYFQRLYELSVAEKEIIRGKVLSFSSSQPSQGDDMSQMQNSLVSTSEVCLQCVVNAFSVFGCQHMLDIGFVDNSIQAIFPSTAELNCWKTRGVIRILPTLIQYSYMPLP
jgi:exportin-5